MIPTGPEDRTSRSRSRPLIRTYTPGGDGGVRDRRNTESLENRAGRELGNGGGGFFFYLLKKLLVTEQASSKGVKL